MVLPTGNWIICGYGRMGRWLYRNFVAKGITPVIIDPRAKHVEGAAQVILNGVKKDIGDLQDEPGCDDIKGRHPEDVATFEFP